VQFQDEKGGVEQDRFGNGTMILTDGKLIVLTERGDLHLVQATPTAFRELAKVQLFTSGRAERRSRWRMADCMRAIRRNWCGVELAK